MSGELVERLQERMRYTMVLGGVPTCSVPKHELRQVIDALSAPVGDEVAVAVSLHSNENSVCYAPPTADLLQRFDRENQRLKNEHKKLLRVMKAQADLLEENRQTIERLDLITRQRDEALRALDNLSRGCELTVDETPPYRIAPKSVYAKTKAARIRAMSEQEARNER